MAAATPTDNAAGGRNSISYDRATPLNSFGNDFGSLQAQQFAHAQQQSAAAAYMQQQQQQQLRQQQEHSQQPRPDISDFPSLGSPPGLANIAAVGVQQPQASQLYRTIAGARPDRPQAQVQGQRPILTPDDFPALSRSTEPPNSDNASGAGLMSTAGLAPGAGVVDQASSRAPGSELNSSLANGLETTSAYKPPNASLTKAAGTASAQRPVAAADRYGMLGILTTNDYGFDVSKFGLSLPSSGALYPTFGSPWTDQTQSYGLIEPDFKLPACYNASRPPPAITKIPSLMDETLFYIFYTMPRSELQLAAAEELYRRQWRYHKELRLWLTKDPETQPSARTPRGEQGVFIFFDPGVWQRVKKEFLVLYELLEDQGALSAHVDAAGAGVRGGAQSVPPALQQLQAQPGAADSNPPSTQAQLSSMQRQGNVAMSQQQLMMLRQRQQESLQSAGRGMPGQMGFSSAQIGDVSSASDAYSQGIAAAHGLPPHLQMESPATSSNIAEDVAAASMI
ncbi:transcriptional regulator [Coemansia sp. RSA 2706]|nr:transcriptional regulator [Coemansia sp. RSA 2706]KAJ2369146.1 transcriptional regulator [Coemansia sp. RSA 2610]KAJ2738405.1 transcriptional regulator [Coemansia sp. Cherry 401B]